LIWSYRLPSNADVGFCLGTFVLVLICLFLGEVTISLTARLLGRHLENLTLEAVRYQDLSIAAAQAGDKASFQAANKLANEAFGKSFFSQVALSMARLWPVPFALAWMQYRFLEIEFPLPLVGLSLGYIGIFIIIYVAAYVLFKRIKHKSLFLGLDQKIHRLITARPGSNEKPGPVSSPAGKPKACENTVLR